MEIIKYPGREEWSSLIKRPALDVTTLFDTVRTVLDEVREQGDTAVKAYEEKFDKVLLSSLQVSEEEMREADALVAEDLKQAIRTAKANIEKFHASQRFEGKKVETTPGDLLAESGSDRESRLIYSGRNGAFVFHGIDVGSARTYRRMQGDRIMYATEPGRESTSRYPVCRGGRGCK